MTTVQEIVALIENTRIDWSATPQSVMSPASGVITSQEDLEAYQRRDHDLVGYGYFYIDVRNMGADLALMHSTRPGYWETESSLSVTAHSYPRTSSVPSRRPVEL